MTFVWNQACDIGEERGGKCVPRAWCWYRGRKQKLSFCVCVCCFSFPPSALRTAGFRNGSLGNRPSAPFRSNVYQPTEMAVVLNGGTVSITQWCFIRKLKKGQCVGAGSRFNRDTLLCRGCWQACRDSGSSRHFVARMHARRPLFSYPFLHAWKIHLYLVYDL